jgi:hypothetical protein
MIKPLRDIILGYNGDFGDQVTKAGIVLKSTVGKSEGIGPRWFQIYAVGEDHKDTVAPGEWVLVEHGRWSEHVLIEDSSLEKTDGSYHKIWRLDPEKILAASDTKPEEHININPNTVWAPKKTLV